MKRTFKLLIIGFISCNHPTDNTKVLQNRIDSLEHKVGDTYKPGFGGFMASIQVHHAKLWFAGQNENWKLADFEMHEIEETVDDIREYHAGRKETQMIGMLQPAFDSVDNAIQQKSISSFKNSYTLLT
ncbi:MAG: hypothetical protein EOP53_25665, partial [Sphingobacteriales bacterium]